MAQAAIQDPLLEELDRLPPNLQQQIRQLVHALAAAAFDRGPRGDLLRFAVEDPLMPRNDPEPIHGNRRSPEPGLPADVQPQTVLDQIRSLLADGYALTARRLAVEAARRFPEDPKIGAAKRILNDGKATVGSGGPEPTTREEFRWLRNPPPWARGKWVALIGSEVITSAGTLREVLEALKSMDLPQKPLVHHID